MQRLKQVGKPPALSGSVSVLVVAIGEAHQLLHVLGTARELHRAGAKTDLLVPSRWHEQLVAMHAPELSGNILRAPMFQEGRPLYQVPPRLPNLLLSLKRIACYDAVLTPERTSTVLKKVLGARSPRLIHTVHGAGDREKGFDRRIRHFDLIFVAGRKDRDAFLEYGLATADNCHVIGYGKFDVLPPATPRFFPADRPVVLYNPHFDEQVGSWLSFGRELVEAFAKAEDFYFIIAPHVRLRGEGRRLFNVLSEKYHSSHLRFDGGSVHSINMDYTRSADIYAGDVSSQVYEFLQTPRPCVFFDANTAHWRDNPFYRHWTFGDVVSSAEDALANLRSATDRHALYRARQEVGVAAAMANGSGLASGRAATMILEFLRQSPPNWKI